MIGDASEALSILLNRGRSVVAGRLAGAFRNIGRDRIADDILAGMRAAGYKVTETDPFEDASSLLFRSRERSPYVPRIRLMWQDMRDAVIAAFPAPPGEEINVDTYMKNVEDHQHRNALAARGYFDAFQVVGKSVEKVLKGADAGQVRCISGNPCTCRHRAKPSWT